MEETKKLDKKQDSDSGSDSGSDSDSDTVLDDNDTEDSIDNDEDSDSLDFGSDDDSSGDDSSDEGRKSLSSITKNLPLYEKIAIILNKHPKDIYRIKDTDNCVRDRIFYDADDNIFSDIVNRKMKSQWSKDCRSTLAHYDNARIPKIITEKKKEYIDSHHKDSYNNIKKRQIEPPIFTTTILKVKTSKNDSDSNTYTNTLLVKLIKQTGDNIDFIKSKKKGATAPRDYIIKLEHKSLHVEQFYPQPKQSNKQISLYNMTQSLSKEYVDTKCYIQPKPNVRKVVSNNKTIITLDIKSQPSKTKDQYYIFYTIQLSNIQLWTDFETARAAYDMASRSGTSGTSDTDITKYEQLMQVAKNKYLTDMKKYVILNYNYTSNEITIEESLVKDDLVGYSYVIYEEGIDCGGRLKEKIDELSSNDAFNLKKRATSLKCKSLELSNDVNGEKRYYVCPMIWDTHENISLNTTDLYDSSNQILTPDDNKDWRTIKNIDGTHKDISELKDVHFKGTNNESHRNIYTTPKEMRRNIPTQKKSILLSGKRHKSYYKYPGFIRIKDTNDLWPCCFTNRSERVEEWFKPSHTNIYKELKETKISKKNTLNHNELGYISKYLLEHLYIDRYEINKHYTTDELLNGEKHNIYNIIPGKKDKDVSKRTGYISELIDVAHEDKDPSMIPLLVRKGIYTTDNNSFLLALIELLPESTQIKFGTTIQEQIRYLIRQIITHLTEKEFKTLNKGSIELMFRDNHLHISSYQNFIEYLLTGKETEKKYYDFWDYLTRPHEWLFKKGLRLLMLEKEIVNKGKTAQTEEEEYKLVNPYFFDNQLYKKDDVPFAIVIKYTKPNGKDNFEPVQLCWAQILNCNVHKYFPTFTLDGSQSETEMNNHDWFSMNVFNSTKPYDIYKQMMDIQKQKYKKTAVAPEISGLATLFIDDYILQQISDVEEYTDTKSNLKNKLDISINDSVKNDLKNKIIENIDASIEKQKKDAEDDNVKITPGTYEKLKQYRLDHYNISSSNLDELVTKFFNIQLYAILLNIYNYFEHVQTLFDKITTMNILDDTRYTLHDKQIDNSNIYKYMIINHYNKVVLLQQQDNTFIPIYNTQIPKQYGIPTLNIEDIYKQIYKDLLPVQQEGQAQQDVITLPDIESQLKILKNLNDIAFMLIVDDETQPEKIYGIIDSYNNIIPVDYTRSSYNYKKHGEYSLKSHKIILADLSISDFNTRQLNKKYKNVLQFQDIYTLLQSIDSEDIYTISKIYCNKKDYCIGIEITKHTVGSDDIYIYTDIEPILLSELRVVEDSIPSVTTLLTNKTLLDTDVGYINTLTEDELLTEYNMLYKRSGFRLKVDPSRYYMCGGRTRTTALLDTADTADDTPTIPTICGFILGNGTKIKFIEEEIFNIFDPIVSDDAVRSDTLPSTNEYHITTLRNYKFIHTINFLDNMYYTNRYQLDDRIRSIKIIKYYEEIHTIVNVSLKRFLHNDINNSILKDYIKDIVYSQHYNKEEKFLLIYPFIKHICEEILFVKIPYNKYNAKKIYKMDIEDLDKCYNIKLKDSCTTNICSFVSKDDTAHDIVPDKTLLQNFIDSMNEYAEADDSEDIDMAYLQQNYSDKIKVIIPAMQHLLYKAKYINCKQLIYELYGTNDFDNIVYKFTHVLVNDFIKQKSILEGEELVKKKQHYVEHDDEKKFDENDITIASVNTIFKNKSKYTYDREKLIMDYILDWNHNTYIRINTHKEKVDIVRVSVKEVLKLDISNISFLGNILKRKSGVNNEHYTIDKQAETILLE